MRSIISSSIVIVAILAFGPAWAKESAQTSGRDRVMVAAATQEVAHTGAGVVNKVDLQHGKVNLTHGPITTLGWSGMTMDFKVKDASLLKDMRPGQKVKFDVVKEGPGQFYITRIVPLK